MSQPRRRPSSESQVIIEVFYNLQIIYIEHQRYKVNPLVKTKQKKDEFVKLNKKLSRKSSKSKQRNFLRTDFKFGFEIGLVIKL